MIGPRKRASLVSTDSDFQPSKRPLARIDKPFATTEDLSVASQPETDARGLVGRHPPPQFLEPVLDERLELPLRPARGLRRFDDRHYMVPEKRGVTRRINLCGRGLPASLRAGLFKKPRNQRSRSAEYAVVLSEREVKYRVDPGNIETFVVFAEFFCRTSD